MTWHSSSNIGTVQPPHDGAQHCRQISAPRTGCAETGPRCWCSSNRYPARTRGAHTHHAHCTSCAASIPRARGDSHAEEPRNVRDCLSPARTREQRSLVVSVRATGFFRSRARGTTTLLGSTGAVQPFVPHRRSVKSGIDSSVESMPSRKRGAVRRPQTMTSGFCQPAGCGARSPESRTNAEPIFHPAHAGSFMARRCSDRHYP